MNTRLERMLDELMQLRPEIDDAAPLGRVVVEDVAKTYADGSEAVRGVTMRVAAGECYGLLGPNGAGKSTTVGDARHAGATDVRAREVAGFDVVAEPREVRRRIGFAMQEAGVDGSRRRASCSSCRGGCTGSAGRPPRAPGCCWRGRPRPRSPTSAWADSPVACSGGSTWPPRWCTSRRWCSWTSRPRASIRALARRSGSARPAASAARGHGRPHHPLHGRGRPAVRPDRNHRPRQHRGRGHAGRAQGARSAAELRSRTSICTTPGTPSSPGRRAGRDGAGGMSAPASLLIAKRAIVQFPRNPILLGFSLAPVLMMFLVFGALFEGVTHLPGLPDRQLLRVPGPTADPAHDGPGHRQRRRWPWPADFQSRYLYKLLTAPVSIGSIMFGRLLGDSVRLCVAGRRRAAAGDRARRARRERDRRRAADDRARHAARDRHLRRADARTSRSGRKDAAAVQAILPMAYLLIFLTSRLPAARADREPA